MNKGHLVYLEGKIKTHAFTDEQGIKLYKPEVVSSTFRVLNNQVTAVPQEQLI